MTELSGEERVAKIPPTFDEIRAFREQVRGDAWVDINYPKALMYLDALLDREPLWQKKWAAAVDARGEAVLEIGRLLAEHAVLSASRDEARTEIATLTARLADVAASVASSRDDVKVLIGRNAELGADLASCRSALDDALAVNEKRLQYASYWEDQAKKNICYACGEPAELSRENVALRSALAALEEARTFVLGEISLACNTGMRMDLSAREIVGRIRQALAARAPAEDLLARRIDDDLFFPAFLTVRDVNALRNSTDFTEHPPTLREVLSKSTSELMWVRNFGEVGVQHVEKLRAWLQSDRAAFQQLESGDTPWGLCNDCHQPIERGEVGACATCGGSGLPQCSSHDRQWCPDSCGCNRPRCYACDGDGLKASTRKILKSRGAPGVSGSPSAGYPSATSRAEQDAFIAEITEAGREHNLRVARWMRQMMAWEDAPALGTRDRIALVSHLASLEKSSDYDGEEGELRRRLIHAGNVAGSPSETPVFDENYEIGPSETET